MCVAALGLLLAAAPRQAFAHEKWFTDPAVHSTDWRLVWSERTALALGVGVLAVAVFAGLQRLIRDPYWPRLPFLSRMAHGDITLLAVQTAIALIYMAVQPALFAPQLALPTSPGGYALAVLEVVIAFTFITSVLDRAGAAALLALGAVILAVYGPLAVLEQAHYAGIALAIFFISAAAHEAGQPRAPFHDPKWALRGIAAMRVLAGVALLTLALTNKVWNPDLGIAFLANYPDFNVVRLAGFTGFSDASFVLWVGVAETTIGLLLISGVLTRVVILLLLVPFNVTVPFLPAVEMIGHLPIFGILYVLLVHGAGIPFGATAETAEREPWRAPGRSPSPG